MQFRPSLSVMAARWPMCCFLAHRPGGVAREAAPPTKFAGLARSPCAVRIFLSVSVKTGRAGNRPPYPQQED